MYISVSSGITAWANSMNLQGIQAPEMSGITIGAGLWVEAAGAIFNPNFWSTGANTTLNANAFGGDLVLSGNTSVTVTLPWAQKDTAYMVDLEWHVNPQYYAVTNKTTTQFQVDIAAAAAGDQDFYYSLRRLRDL